MPLATLCRKPNWGTWRDQKRKPTRKRQSHDDKHPLGRTLPRRKWPSPPRVYRAIKLALCNERAFGMSLRARRVLDACIIHLEAVGRSRLLILAPLSNPGIKSRIREENSWRTTFSDNYSISFKLDFKLAWHKV